MEKTLNPLAIASEQFKEAFEQSRVALRLERLKNLEKSGTSLGLRIARFYAKKATATFAALGGRAATFAAMIGQQMDDTADEAIETIKTGIDYVQRTYATPDFVAAPETSIKLTTEFASAELLDAIESQVEHRLHNVELIMNDEVFGPFRPEMANLIEDFNSGAVTTREFRRDALRIKGVIVADDGRVAISHELNTQLRDSFNDGGLGPHEIHVFEDNPSHFSLKQAFSNFVRDRIAPIFTPSAPQPAFVPAYAHS